MEHLLKLLKKNRDELKNHQYPYIHVTYDSFLKTKKPIK